MPDLIIKPAAQSGNKVIIQDQAGGAVITTADSGATIANATLVTPALGTPASGVATNLTGIPAAQVSGVLPVGVTGGSGLDGANMTVVTANLSNTYRTDAGGLDCGNIAIPSAGLWRVEACYRIRFSGGTKYIRSALSSSSGNNTSNIITNWRMLCERITVTTFGNIGTDAVWLMDFPTGATYPYTVYTKMYISSGDAYFGNVNDSNGIPTFVAMKYKNTTNTDSTIRQI